MSWLDQVLNSFGIQGRPFRALLRALLLMDLRSQHYSRATGTKPDELIPPLYWVLAQYLFISAVVSVALFMRVSAQTFAFVNLSVAMMLALAAVLVEFNEVVLDVEDAQVIGPTPLVRSTYTCARLANLAFYVSLIVLALTLFPSILGMALRDSGFGFCPGYLLASAIGCVAVVLVAIILYSLAPPRRGQRDFRDLLAWIQILVAMAAFYGGQLMFRDGTHSIEMFFEQPPPWLSWLPSAWLATLVSQMTGSGSLGWLRWIAVALIVVLLLGLWTILRLNTYYHQAQSASFLRRPQRRPDVVRPLVGPISRWLAGPTRPPAPLALCLRMLWRDSDLKSRTWPSLATMMAFLGVGLVLRELGDPFCGFPEKAFFSIVVIQLAVLAVPTILHNMGFSRDYAAAWLFQSAPASSRRACAEAARMAAVYGILLPVFLVLWICFAVAWASPWHAALHCSFGWCSVVIASHLTSWGMHYPLPFSEPAVRGGVAGPVIPYLAGIGTLAMLLGAGEYYAAKSTGLLLLYAALLVALTVSIRQLPRWTDARRKVIHA